MTQILQIVEKAWEDFLEYYNERVEKYVKEIKLSNNEEFLYEKAKKEHWICWNEADLLMHLGRFIYKNLEEKSIDGIEIHLDKNLSLNNFSQYIFKDKLRMLKDLLGIKRAPKVDLIIAKEADFTVPFLLCGEVKCFHASVEAVSGKRRTLEEELEKDIKELKAIKELGIAEDGVFFIFDDYYYLFEPEKAQIIKEKTKEAKQHGIIIHYDKSKAKLL